MLVAITKTLGVVSLGPRSWVKTKMEEAQWGKPALTLCILASVSTMFLSTWSAFFCSCSIRSESSLLEMLQMGGTERWDSVQAQPPASEAGPSLGPRQDLPTQPGFQELACPHRMKPLTHKECTGQGYQPLLCPLDLKLLFCCVVKTQAFLFFSTGVGLSVLAGIHH